MSTLHESMARNGFVRPARDRVFGGVCAGLGRRFGIEPWPARLLFVLVLMILPGSQILIYPVLWILMPSEIQAYYPAPQGYQPAPQGYQPAPPAPGYPVPPQG